MAAIYKLAPGAHGPVVPEAGQSPETVFAELLDAGWSMYDLSDPRDAKVMEHFDPTAILIVAVPWRAQPALPPELAAPRSSKPRRSRRAAV